MDDIEYLLTKVDTHMISKNLVKDKKYKLFERMCKNRMINTYSIFRFAVKRDDREIIEIISKYYTVSHHAVCRATKYLTLDIVKFLMNNKSIEIDIDVLTSAIIYRKYNIADYLFDNLKVEKETVYRSVLFSSGVDSVKYLQYRLDNPSLDGFLFYAIEYNNFAAIDYLITQNVDIRKCSYDLMRCLIVSNKFDIVKKMISIFEHPIDTIMKATYEVYCCCVYIDMSIYNVVKEKYDKSRECDLKDIDITDCPVCFEELKEFNVVHVHDKLHPICKTCDKKINRCHMCRKNLPIYEEEDEFSSDSDYTSDSSIYITE